MTDSRYTEGVCGDGAAILLDGQPLAIHLILEALAERDALATEARTLRNAAVTTAALITALQEAVEGAERVIVDAQEYAEQHHNAQGGWHNDPYAYEIVDKLREWRSKHGGSITVLRAACAASGVHDYDGCDCSDDELLRSAKYETRR